MFSKKKDNKGFTLVELLVVIAIIGILAVVAVPALFKNIEKGKVADLEADISSIRSASLSVYSDTSSYPEGPVTGSGGTELIDKELEGLSKPFEGTYSLSKVDIMDADTPSKKVGEKLQLTIGKNSSSDMKKISAEGVKKLRKDLGDKLLTPSGESEATYLVIDLIVNK
ncbi:type IV pilin protein [[Clostridium] dakarense]|uniref:type IV pilin protein n=1 Tax=Faecalimicrobium dakarense TaxID=1301100 RepID=UPI0004BBA589|nr:type II secretion system protein [[Clostridium] dakarense]